MNPVRFVLVRVGTHSAAFIAGISGVTVTNPLPVVIGPDGQLGTASASSLQGPPGPTGPTGPIGPTGPWCDWSHWPCWSRCDGPIGHRPGPLVTVAGATGATGATGPPVQLVPRVQLGF